MCVYNEPQYLDLSRVHSFNVVLDYRFEVPVGEWEVTVLGDLFGMLSVEIYIEEADDTLVARPVAPAWERCPLVQYIA